MADRTKIDWADASISPLGWGCYGPMGDKVTPMPCSYCYAHRLAKRKLRDCPDCQAFIPHWHPEQLSKMEKWIKPKRIFIQSMGDLFHPDIPSQRIEQVLDTIVANNLFRIRHTYFFLTKNPARYAEFIFPDNCWLGATITDATSDLLSEDKLYPNNLFYSFEPLLGRLRIEELCWFYDIKWIIIGSLSGPGAKKSQPEREWIETIIAQADAMGIPVFIKQSIYNLYPDLPKRREMPRE